MTPIPLRRSPMVGETSQSDTPSHEMTVRELEALIGKRITVATEHGHVSAILHDLRGYLILDIGHGNTMRLPLSLVGDIKP